MNALKQIVQTHYRDRLKTTLADPTRLEAVYGSRFWTQPDREKLRQFCITASTTLNAPVAQVSLVTDSEQVIVAAVGKEDARAESLDFSVCQHTVGVGMSLNVNDLRHQVVLCDLKSVTDQGLVAYLGVPLLDRNGNILGAFCAADFEERSWSDMDVTMLTHLASALVAMHEGGRFIDAED